MGFRARVRRGFGFCKTAKPVLGWLFGLALELEPMLEPSFGLGLGPGLSSGLGLGLEFVLLFESEDEDDLELNSGGRSFWIIFCARSYRAICSSDNRPLSCLEAEISILLGCSNLIRSICPARMAFKVLLFRCYHQ